MNRKELKNQINSFDTIINKAKANKTDTIDGHIKINARKNKVEYYLISNNKKKFLGTKPTELIRTIIQNDYDRKIIHIAQSQKKAYERSKM